MAGGGGHEGDYVLLYQPVSGHQTSFWDGAEFGHLALFSAQYTNHESQIATVPVSMATTFTKDLPHLVELADDFVEEPEDVRAGVVMLLGDFVRRLVLQTHSQQNRLQCKGV